MYLIQILSTVVKREKIFVVIESPEVNNSKNWLWQCCSLGLSLIVSDSIEEYSLFSSSEKRD